MSGQFTTDVFLLIGTVVLVLAVPSILSAFVDGRSPRTPAIMLLIGGGLVALAITQHPGGYSITDIPGAAARVVNAMIP